MLNVHIYPSPFTHESRILKEVGTLGRRLGFEQIELLGVTSPQLETEERVNDVTTIKRFAPAKGTRGVSKLVGYLLWCLTVLLYCLKQRPGCVNCHSLPVLPIGVALKMLTGAKLVYDAHELETETVGSRGLRRFLAKVLERTCLSVVDLIIVVSPGIEQWYRETYGVTNIITVLNAPPYTAAPPSTNRFRRAFGIGSREKIVLYQGVLAPHRGVEQLVAAAPLLRKNGYALVFMGYGPMFEALQIDSRTRGEFYLHSAVNSDVLLTYTAAADIGLCLIQDGCLSYRLCLPNKLFEYVGAGIPVVASDLPEMRRVVEGCGVGVCLGSSAPEDVLMAVRHAAAMAGSDLKERLDAVSRAHCWEVQEDRLVEAYRKHIFK